MRQLVRHFEENTKGRDFIVGDIHNCFSLFEKELDKVNVDFSVDRVFSVGDLFDRGPEPKEMTNFFLEQYGYGFYPVVGNHELLFKYYHLGEDYHGMFMHNGGEWVNKIDYKTLTHLYAAVNNLPYIITIAKGDKLYSVSHSEITSNWKEDSEDKLKQMAWSRRMWSDPNIETPEEFENCFIGHTIHKKVKRVGKYIDLDTGSYYHNKITLMELT